MVLTVSHLGLCVSDLERSLRFYRDGLGFEPAGAHEVGGEFARLMELGSLEVSSRMLRRDGVMLELLAFATPAAVGPADRRPMNQLGFTHLALRVDDVAAVAATIEEFGGAVVEGTRTVLDIGGMPLDFVYCTDPDGVRIELMALGG